MDNDKSPKVAWLRSAVERFEGPLIRYAASLTGDGERARDVVQDTFVRLWDQSPDQLNGRLAEWLFTVCRRRAIDVRRKESRMTALTELNLSEEAAPGLTPVMMLSEAEVGNDLARLMEMLPPDQREVLRLKFQSGLSYKEISVVTRLSVSNVGYLLHVAIKTLRTRMRELEGHR